MVEARFELHPKTGMVLLYLSGSLIRAADPYLKIEGRQWLSQREGKPYAIPLNTESVKQLRLLADQFSIPIPPTVEEAFAGAPLGEAPYRIEVVGDSAEIYFPYDESLVKLMQSFHGRRYEAMPKRRWVITNDLRNYLPMLALLETCPQFVLSDAAKQWLNALYKRYKDQPAGLDVTVDGTSMVLKCAVSSSIEGSVKALPLATGKDGEYSLPILRNTVESVERLCKRANTPIPASIREAIQGVLDSQEVLFELSKAEASEMEFPNLTGTPFPFQKAGIAYALKSKGCIIGDEMGLGKTIQGIGVIDYVTKSLKDGVALVFCPPQLAYNWAKELRLWIKGDLRIAVLSGYKHKTMDVFSANVVIIPYSIVYERWKNGILNDLAGMNVKCVIMDEFHYLKEHRTTEERDPTSGKKVRVYDTNRVRGVWEIVNRLNIPYRVGLTGTAMTNNPIELATQLDIIGMINLFGGFTEYRNKYCAGQKTRYGWKFGTVPKAVAEELHDRLRRTCYVRRTVSQVMKELPPLLMSRVWFKLPAAAQNKYDQAEADTIAWIADLATKDAAFTLSIQGLSPKEREAAIKRRGQEASRKAERAAALTRIAALRQLAAELKMDQAVKWIQGYLDDSGEKLLVFCHHRAVQKQLIGLFPGAARLISSDSKEEREKQKDRFRDDPDCRLMILSDMVGAEGHTLVSARGVVFLEMPWTPKDVDQCMKRAHRIGQLKLVNVYFLLLDKTIDTDMDELVTGKRRQVNLVLDGVDHGTQLAEVDGNESISESSMQQALITRLKTKKPPIHA